MRISVTILIVFLFVGLVGCISNAERIAGQTSKINGVSFAAAKSLIDSTDLVSVKEIHANWISLMPYGFVREGGVELQYNSNWQWVGETPEGIREDIKMAKQQGFKIMLKPHVWISHGNYTGDFRLTSEENWQKFETSYKKYILEFAAIAEQQNVEMFCMGTEWRKFIKERPQFWFSLIIEIRKIYTGKLTYAANWDEYNETPFWSKLDYIGVNAYFPLSNSNNPSVEQLQNSWQLIIPPLKQLSATSKKPILFTEFGYRSIEGTTIKPWESYTDAAINMKEQQIALEALFKSNWKETWFEGGFLWKWFHRHETRGGVENGGYTTQNKPASLVVKKYYEHQE